jgi:hypothetical protein
VGKKSGRRVEEEAWSYKIHVRGGDVHNQSRHAVAVVAVPGQRRGVQTTPVKERGCCTLEPPPSAAAHIAFIGA